MNADNNKNFSPIEDPALHTALSELGRIINLVTTYGKKHPAVLQAIKKAYAAITDLFVTRKKVIIGNFNGVLTVNEQTVFAEGTLLKSLERRLVRLHITGLRLAQGITEEELVKLAELLSSTAAEDFQTGLSQTQLAHIQPENTRYQAVRDGETVASESDLSGSANEDAVLILDDEADISNEGSGSGSSDVHVDQIVAFLKGDINLEDDESIGEELAELASDPEKLGKMIMESVSIRQSASAVAGESLGDIVLGCLRRTFDGIRKQPSLKSSKGMDDMQKSLLLLEDNLLKRMRQLTGEENPELDRQIVQSIREMDEELGFERAAYEYMEHQGAIDAQKEKLQAYIENKGPESAQELIQETDFPKDDWRRIVVESRNREKQKEQPEIAAGLSSLANVFEKLETLMKSEGSAGTQVKDLLGKANANLDDTLYATRGKLEELSRHLLEDETGTIGGQGRHMSQEQLLADLSEVAQELMQPLTAINASLEMMLHGFVGDVTEDQRDLLDLASNSGEHLKYLMRELIEIVGCPANRGVDSRYHTTSDAVRQLQDAVGQEKLPLFFQ